MTKRPAIAILDDYQDYALRSADWSRVQDLADVIVFTEHLPTEDDVVATLEPFEIVVAMRERTQFRRSTLERLPNLKLLVTAGSRNAAIDLAAASDLDIMVCGTEGSGLETAEHAWALILAAARRLDIEIANVRNGHWMTTVGTTLRGRKLGVIGLGQLGGEVASIGKAFGMEVAAWSQNLTAERCAEIGVSQAASLDDLLATSDFVTIHLVLSRRTRGLLGAGEFAKMKPTAWLVNTSRGPICDEEALAAACEREQIGGAALDVYGTEPLPVDHPFRRLPNVIATPHIGYVTDTALGTWYSAMVEDLEAYLAGTPIRILNPPA
jgi:phosphoglycerate dehydrogenase-like enzyme